ncbi:MAG: hypothetical protein K6G27_14825 [Lachnospiraceae bacterium]|nr:hypothetical protein [Lachnospiraceae bacterium]
MKVIGRKAEIKELGYYAEKKSELVRVYGRRKVGKTFLVEQTFGEYFAFRATGMEKGKTRDLSVDEFTFGLESVILPVYKAAQNCGFAKWEYKGVSV